MGPHRLGIRRDVNPGAVAAHVVMIDVCLRDPVGEEDLGHVPGFGQVQSERRPDCYRVRRTCGTATAGPRLRIRCRAFFAYQSATMFSPSGLKDGTTGGSRCPGSAWSRRRCRERRSYASSGAICAPPISVACRLIDWQTTALPSATSFLASGSATPLGSLMRLFTCRSRSRFAIFAGDETITRRKGFPIVVGPMSTTLELARHSLFRAAGSSRPSCPSGPFSGRCRAGNRKTGPES